MQLQFFGSRYFLKRAWTLALYVSSLQFFSSGLHSYWRLFKLNFLNIISQLLCSGALNYRSYLAQSQRMHFILKSSIICSFFISLFSWAQNWVRISNSFLLQLTRVSISALRCVSCGNILKQLVTIIPSFSISKMLNPVSDFHAWANYFMDFFSPTPPADQLILLQELLQLFFWSLRDKALMERYYFYGGKLILEGCSSSIAYLLGRMEMGSLSDSPFLECKCCQFPMILLGSLYSVYESIYLSAIIYQINMSGQMNSNASKTVEEFFLNLDTKPEGTISNAFVPLDYVIQSLSNKFFGLDFSQSSIVTQKYKTSLEGSRKMVVYLTVVIANQQYYQYCGLHQFLPEKAQTRLIWEALNSQEELVREVCFSPGNEYLYLVQQKVINKYAFKDRGSQANATLSSLQLSSQPITQMVINDDISVSEVVSHPSGLYLIGTGTGITDAFFLLKIVDNQPAKALDASSYGCIQARLFNKGSLDFDHSTEHGFITATGDKICYWEWGGSQAKLLGNATMVKQADFVYYGNRALFPKDSSKITHIKFIKNNKYILAVDLEYFGSHYLKWDPVAAKISYQFTVMFKQEYINDPRIEVNAVEIPALDTIFFYQDNYDVGEFVKIIESENRSVTLLPQNYNEQIHEVFYEDNSSKLCFIKDSNLHCHNLLTQCQQGIISFQGCVQNCLDKGQFWNAGSWKCQSCPDNQNCACPAPYQSINLLTGQCQINCGIVSQASPATEYFQRGQLRCFCPSGFEWSVLNQACLTICPKNSNSQICRCPPGFLNAGRAGQCLIDCSQIKYSLVKVAQSSQQLNGRQACLCRSGFEYVRSQGQSLVGICQIKCQRPTSSHWRQGQPFCNCNSGEQWQGNQLKCVGDKDGGMEGWKVALIVFFVLAACGVLLFFLFKKWRKSFRIEKKNQTEQQLQTQSDEPPSDRRAPSDRQISQKDSNVSETKQAPVCQVCNQPGVNCNGPCRHDYHFDCIMGRINMGDSSCPLCSRQFGNGLADIQVHEDQDQIHSIGD